MRNIVLICLDCVRVDMFREYNKSVSMDILAPIRAELDILTPLRCYSSSSWTGPSIVSLLTGLYPSEIENCLDATTWWNTKLPSASLIEGFNKSVCITANPCMTSFERYFDICLVTCTTSIPIGGIVSSQIASLKHGSRVLSRLKYIIPSLEQPFFLYIHLMSAHYPCSLDHIETASKIYTDKHQQDYWSGVYTSIEFAAKCLSYLKVFDPLVAIFSDHGDTFAGEHGHTKWKHCMHTSSLYEELIKVPLLINEKVDRTSTLELRQLIPILKAVSANEEIPSSREIISQVITLPLMYNHEQLLSHIIGSNKIIYNVNKQTVERYDLDKDPSETQSLPVDPIQLEPLMKYIVPYDPYTKVEMVEYNNSQS